MLLAVTAAKPTLIATNCGRADRARRQRIRAGGRITLPLARDAPCRLCPIRSPAVCRRSARLCRRDRHSMDAVADRDFALDYLAAPRRPA